eukprot:3440171-Pleurochrysis_carterae.AAC.1
MNVYTLRILVARLKLINQASGRHGCRSAAWRYSRAALAARRHRTEAFRFLHKSWNQGTPGMQDAFEGPEANYV